MLKITYLSHSAFLLDDGTSKLYIDPFFTGNPNAPAGAGSVSAGYIVLTHGHGDHLGDTFSLAKRDDALVIAVNELANYVAQHGIKAHNMHIGGSHAFPFGTVKFTIAQHGSADDKGRYLGLAAGVLITMGGSTIYHAGDTGLFYDMKLIGEMNKIDVAMLPIGDNFTMGVDDAAKAVEFLAPRLTIPIHYNTFPVIKADPAAFARKISASGHTAKILSAGESITLPA